MSLERPRKDAEVFYPDFSAAPANTAVIVTGFDFAWMPTVGIEGLRDEECDERWFRISGEVSEVGGGGGFEAAFDAEERSDIGVVA